MVSVVGGHDDGFAFLDEGVEGGVHDSLGFFINGVERFV